MRSHNPGTLGAALAFAYAAIALTLAFHPVARAEAADPVSARPAISMAGQSFSSWQDYYTSSYFIENGKRCGKPESIVPRAVSPGDCTFTFTNPSGDYVPGDVYEIPVVVHILEHSNGNGAISDALVQSQIDILNEDFRALSGTPGAGGYDSGIQFVLADTDPGGQPTTGITRTVHDSWFNDSGNYWDTLAWDTAKYMNIYTNKAGGNLGYVPNLPQSGLAGANYDRVVLLWSAVGRNAVGGPPYNQGRTATHEVGHYLGLEHTFNGGCAASSQPACHSSGDLICDTNSEANPRYGCPNNPQSCGSVDPFKNFMDYTDDTCMDLFSVEQSLRMRCSLLNYRADLYAFAGDAVCGDNIRANAEDCDGTDDAACTGLCEVDCSCPTPVCGNDVVELGEQCDGTSTAACPTGTCEPSCNCPAPICGNDVTETGEQCDGADDGSCPALCQGDCSCLIVCNEGDLEIINGKSDAKRFIWKADLDNFSGAYDGIDPRAQFQFTVIQGSDSVTVNLPAYGAGWDRSRPERGKYKWRGLLGGIKTVKAIDRTARKGVWQIKLKGTEVPGADQIDVITQFADVELTMDGKCGSGNY
jgi:hypothetical protein